MAAPGLKSALAGWKKITMKALMKRKESINWLFKCCVCVSESAIDKNGICLLYRRS